MGTSWLWRRTWGVEKGVPAGKRIHGPRCFWTVVGRDGSCGWGCCLPRSMYRVCSSRCSILKMPSHSRILVFSCFISFVFYITNRRREEIPVLYRVTILVFPDPSLE
ncbi:hypothetical protein COCCADRAFT_104914 [Bipolaris zeicola 26-R-13]|uniref:Uncharacterized protein n=2 Tax=Bipolaris TaxID=33194 RepID=W6XRG9_COCC2|nr:uncharacterized protein COCCADRAFT_104914 [Bipolaris zeicola 26-R-13]EUC30047.1 hypothetical protein COCCADRAFT_104914 [Bipolaris zeicola 26-R-13]